MTQRRCPSAASLLFCLLFSCTSDAPFEGFPSYPEPPDFTYCDEPVSEPDGLVIAPSVMGEVAVDVVAGTVARIEYVTDPMSGRTGDVGVDECEAIVPGVRITLTDVRSAKGVVSSDEVSVLIGGGSWHVLVSRPMYDAATSETVWSAAPGVVEGIRMAAVLHSHPETDDWVVLTSYREPLIWFREGIAVPQVIPPPPCRTPDRLDSASLSGLTEVQLLDLLGGAQVSDEVREAYVGIITPRPDRAEYRYTTIGTALCEDPEPVVFNECSEVNPCSEPGLTCINGICEPD